MKKLLTIKNCKVYIRNTSIFQYCKLKNQINVIILSYRFLTTDINNSQKVINNSTIFTELGNDDVKNNYTYSITKDHILERTVYVQNLRYGTFWTQLKTFMSDVGEVAFCKVIESHQGNYFGKVQYADKITADKAIEKYNGVVFRGEKITVVKAFENDDNSITVGTQAYIFNLDWLVTEEELFEHLKRFAQVVQVSLIKDRAGLSRGSAIVKFTSPEETLKAINNGHNSLLRRRKLGIREDRDAADAVKFNLPPGFYQNKENIKNIEGADGNNVYELTAFVSFLRLNVTSEQLFNHLSQFAEVEHVQLLYSNDGNSKGCAVVTFKSPEDTRNAIMKAANTEIKGKKLKIRLNKF